MRVEKVVIENFRCFKGLNVFEITGETIILYGENGYGKSSFFDAMEWCLTGNIDRFRKTGETSLDKSIIVNRLASFGEICSVEMKIGKMIIRREFKIIDNPRETVIVHDGETGELLAKGKNSVEKYINENIAHETTNKKLFNELVKKSHILSQDQITDFVLRDNPKERFNALADIMGYRQPINLVNNLKIIQDAIKRNIEKKVASIEAHEELI